MVTLWAKPKVNINETLTYFVYQMERAPTTNKLHYQGYAEFSKALTYGQVKKLFDQNDMHIEPRYGSQLQAIEYCTKEETREEDTKPVIMGKPKQQGNRSDLDSLYDAIVESEMTPMEIIREFKGTAIKNIFLIEKVQKIYWDLDPLEDQIKEARKTRMEARAILDKMINKNNPS